jgi:hypothetical protein
MSPRGIRRLLTCFLGKKEYRLKINIPILKILKICIIDKKTLKYIENSELLIEICRKCKV